MRAFFLGWTAQYERRFIAYLGGRYPAEFAMPPKLAQRAQRKIGSFNKRFVNMPLSDRWLGRLVCGLWQARASDMLICNEGQVRRHVNPAVVRAFPGHKVLLVRDLIDADFLAEVRPLFDRVYSFDEQQCAVLGMRPLNQFFTLGFHEASRSPTAYRAAGITQKCFFLGRDKGRAATLCTLARSLVASGCDVDFHIVRDSTTVERSAYHVDAPMDYQQNLDRARQADVLVEVNQPGQAGATLRALEAAYFGKKLITNNPAVKRIALYHPANVLILEGLAAPDPARLAEFLAKPVHALPESVLYRYSPDYMLEQLIADAQALRSACRSAH